MHMVRKMIKRQRRRFRMENTKDKTDPKGPTMAQRSAYVPARFRSQEYPECGTLRDAQNCGARR
jgi:hypothetical protein